MRRVPSGSLWHDPHVRRHGLPTVRESLARFRIRHRRHDDDVLALLPVHRCRDLEPRRELAGIEEPQHLVEVATRAHRVDKHCLDQLVGPDQVDRAHGLIVDGRAAFGSRARIGRQHVVELRHRQVAVADQRIADHATGCGLDVGEPALVIGDRIDRQADHLAVAPLKLRLEPGEIPELGRADRREVLWMRKQQAPGIADPLVEADRARGRFGREIRCPITDAQGHGHLPLELVRFKGPKTLAPLEGWGYLAAAASARPFAASQPRS